MEIAH